MGTYVPMNESWKSALSAIFSIAGTTRSRRQSRASGHLDMTWASRGTSLDALKVEDVGICDINEDLSSEYIVNGKLQNLKSTYTGRSRERRTMSIRCERESRGVGIS